MSEALAENGAQKRHAVISAKIDAQDKEKIGEKSKWAKRAARWARRSAFASLAAIALGLGLLPGVAAASCTGLYELSAPAMPGTVSTGSYAYLAQQQDYTSTGSPGTSGHLTAQAIQADGSLSATPAWDAAALMTLPKRRALLYTQGASGNLVTLAAARSNLALLPATVAAQMAKNGSNAIAALINPNHSSGAWLAGRDPSSLMGRPLRFAPFLAGEAVVVGTEDGLLYGFDKVSGQLLWGFIPANMLPSTQTPGALIGTEPWGQGMSVAVGGSTYVAVTAAQGAEHLALKLAADGTLQSVAWEDYEPTPVPPATTVSPISPAGGAAPTMAVDQTGSAAGKVAYIVNNTFKTVSVVDGGGAQLTPLTTTATSNPIYLNDSAAYYGDDQGTIKGVLGAPDIGSLGESSPNAVLWLTGAYQSSTVAAAAGGASVFVIGASSSRVAAFSAGTQSAPAAGAQLWQLSASSSAGVPSLPSGAAVTAMPSVANGYVFVGATQGTDLCTEQAYEIGPLSLATGSAQLSGTAFRLASIASPVTALGTGEALFANAAALNGKPEVFALANGGGGSTSAQGWGQYTYVAADAGPQNKRLDWRELTNFLLDAIGQGSQ